MTHFYLSLLYQTNKMRSWAPANSLILALFLCISNGCLFCILSAAFMRCCLGGDLFYVPITSVMLEQEQCTIEPHSCIIAGYRYNIFVKLPFSRILFARLILINSCNYFFAQLFMPEIALYSSTNW